MSACDHDPPPPIAPPYTPIPVDKSLPRPAPTMEYSWTEYNPDATRLYIRSHKEADTQLARLKYIPTVFGFDLEWKPTFIKGASANAVALIQLASDSVIFLFQVSSMQEFPSRLAQLLADPLIVKAGVAIQTDAKKLFDDYNIPMTNCVDLSLLARTVDNARWQGKYNSSLGLARLIEAYDYRILGKGKVTRSNWEAVLNQLQIEYASNDAHAGFRLYTYLNDMLRNMPVAPNPAWYSFNYFAGQMRDSNGFEWYPYNPQYDPGPQPPPRPPREAKKKMTASEAETDEFTSASNDNTFRAEQGQRNLFRGKNTPGENSALHAPDNTLAATSEWGGVHDQSAPSDEQSPGPSYHAGRGHGMYNRNRRNNNRNNNNNDNTSSTPNRSRGGGTPRGGHFHKINNKLPMPTSAPAVASGNNSTGHGESSFFRGANYTASPLSAPAISNDYWASVPPAQALDWEASPPPAQAWEAGPSAQAQRTQNKAARGRPYRRRRGKGSRSHPNANGPDPVGSTPQA